MKAGVGNTEWQLKQILRALFVMLIKSLQQAYFFVISFGLIVWGFYDWHQEVIQIFCQAWFTKYFL